MVEEELFRVEVDVLAEKLRTRVCLLRDLVAAKVQDCLDLHKERLDGSSVLFITFLLFLRGLLAVRVTTLLVLFAISIEGLRFQTGKFVR